ncbi:hypothetical protein B0F90DRAFT_1342542 [Multifurca ochricompacta]|uniref:Crinkler effector protein N-terminal domain-containing protein n=1 Tax=Multifurca ochricompacta TaxID=376703 RepID=A0AAD4LZ09_9AGAM|nr:hypothetical protein B0F90DRAFT_1342542 [Multifurca ochricompacta]
MATALTLFCLAIDNQKDFIGDVFDVEIQANSLVSRLKDAIKVKMAHQLGHVDANQLTLWKLSTPLCIDPETSTISTVKNTIRKTVLPSADAKEAGLGNGTVQVLYPTKRLSNYWNNIPNEDHLHLVIQVPFNSPENLLEDLPGDSPKPPYADLITFTVPSAQRFLSLKRIDFYTREVEVATGQPPSYIHDFLGSLNRQRVISPNATGSSMLREHLGDFFDTYFREETNSEDPPTVTNSEIGLYSHVLSSSEILATGNFGFEKEGHTGAAFLFDVAGEFRRLAGEIGNAEL